MLRGSCCQSQAPLFTLKSKLFSKSTFVIGYDTAIRLIMPKYYGGEVNMLLEMTAMRGRGCSFLVAGRLDGQTAFKTMDDVELPEHLRDIVRTRSAVHIIFCLSKPQTDGVPHRPSQACLCIPALHVMMCLPHLEVKLLP